VTRPWWGREARGAAPRRVYDPPSLADDLRADIEQESSARRPAFTPEWRLRRKGDPADAMMHLHAELAEPVLQRINRLPEKLYTEFLRTAGVAPAPAKPARAVLAFTVADSSPRSVTVAEGFQVSASGGDGERVVFETERNLYAAPGDVSMLVVQDGNRFSEIHPDDENAAAAFGSQPVAGSAFLIGLSSEIPPTQSVSMYVRLKGEGGRPSPVMRGRRSQNESGPVPILRWSVFNGIRFEDAEVIQDETRRFSQSGILEIRCPRVWKAGTPANLAADNDLRWLRLQLVAGEFADPPMLSRITLNAVTAIAARTVRNEVLEYVAGSERRKMRVSQKPVLAGSMRLVVNEGTISGAAGGASGNEAFVWEEVDDLNAAAAEAKVFELDEASGVLTFGDGNRGAALPEGFRHVIAERYQVASGAASSVDAEAVSGLLSSAPFLTEVTNPERATGGRDAEPADRTLARGPRQVRARDRSVTIADYNLLALDATGASVTRAHSVAGVHAGQVDAEVPGTVSIYLTGEPAAEGPPYPDPGSLEAVARFLVDEIAPAGIEVVAAAPYFHEVSVRASLVLNRNADQVAVLNQSLDVINRYLDPLHGGDDGNGWPFGGEIVHNLLVQKILAEVPQLEGITQLNLIVDAVTHPSCANFVPQANSLLWTLAHELTIVERVSS
jgi:predicted phage baseplate assembly protein